MTVVDARPATVTERVDAGEAYLDERLPGWRKLVTRTILSMQSPSWCVLAQLQGAHPELVGRGEGPDRFERALHTLRLSDEQARAYGFLAEETGSLTLEDQDYNLLTQEWRKRLSPRPFVLIRRLLHV